MKYRKMLVALVLAATTVSACGAARPDSGLTYRDVAGEDPYESLARATSGSVVYLARDAGSAEVAAQMKASAEDAKYALLLAAEGAIAEGGADYEIAVDSTVSALAVTVSGLHQVPRVEIRGAAKEVVTPSRTLASLRAQRLVFDAPQPGRWRVHVDAATGENVRLVVRGTTDQLLRDVRVAKPGQDGEDKGPLQAGAKETFEVNLGREGLKNVAIQLVSLDGHVLASAKASGRGDASPAAGADLRIPDRAFRVRASGELATGERIERLYDWPYAVAAAGRE